MPLLVLTAYYEQTNGNFQFLFINSDEDLCLLLNALKLNQTLNILFNSNMELGMNLFVKRTEEGLQILCFIPTGVTAGNAQSIEDFTANLKNYLQNDYAVYLNTEAFHRIRYQKSFLLFFLCTQIANLDFDALFSTISQSAKAFKLDNQWAYTAPPVEIGLVAHDPAYLRKHYPDNQTVDTVLAKHQRNVLGTPTNELIADFHKDIVRKSINQPRINISATDIFGLASEVNLSLADKWYEIDEDRVVINGFLADSLRELLETLDTPIDDYTYNITHEAAGQNPSEQLIIPRNRNTFNEISIDVTCALKNAQSAVFKETVPDCAVCLLTLFKAINAKLTPAPAQTAFFKERNGVSTTVTEKAEENQAKALSTHSAKPAAN